jgi:hypothetical protein
MADANSNAVQPVRGQRWFRFSLRALFVVMTVAAVWLGFAMQRIRERHQAIEAILNRGGTIVFDGAEVQGEMQAGTAYLASSTPSWRNKILGKYGAYVDRGVGSISLGAVAPIRAESTFDVFLLGRLPEMTSLALYDRVDETALAHLPELPNLHLLQIGSDASLTDAGLQCLERMPELRLLWLRGAKLTAEGYRHIVGRKKLNNLVLSDCKVTAEGLEQLTTLPKLTVLEIDALGDWAIPHLSRMRDLQHVSIFGSKLSKDGAGKLRAALPNCTITGTGALSQAGQ